MFSPIDQLYVSSISRLQVMQDGGLDPNSVIAGMKDSDGGDLATLGQALINILRDAYKVILGVGIALGVVLVAWHAIRGMVSASGRGKEESKGAIFGVLVGVAIAILATGIVGLIVNVAAKANIG